MARRMHKSSFCRAGVDTPMFLTPTEAVMVLKKNREKTEKYETTKSNTIPSISEQKTENSESLSPVLRMAFAGANQTPAVTGQDKLPGIVNYFIGDDPKKWRTKIPTYKKVAYEGVYPGIDLVYYGNQGQLEYDLVVAPGADPNQIQLAFEGAEHLSVNKAGDLVLDVDGGEVRLLQPQVYQMVDGRKVEVAANYVLGAFSSSSSRQETTFVIPAVSGRNLPEQQAKMDSGQPQAGMNNAGSPSQGVRIHLAAYDHAKPLIVDPVLFFATYLGGSSNDDGRGIAVDAAGAVYVTGETTSTDFPTLNASQLASGGGDDAFVTKLNALGTRVYSTYLGGSSNDDGRGIAVDAAGTPYVSGATASTDFPTINAMQSASGGGTDTFVTQFNAGGVPVYSTYLGGSSTDVSISGGIAVDAAGVAYVTGWTNSTDFPTLNASQATNGGIFDTFVTKLDPSQLPANQLVYSTYLGGSSSDQAFGGIAVDAAGAAYVSGVTLSTDFPTVNPLQATLGGNQSAYVTQFNAAGARVYSTYLGGSSTDDGRGIAVDAAGAVYVTGSTFSTDFPTLNASQPTHAGDVDAFVTKLDPSQPPASQLVYSTYLGGSTTDGGEGIALNAAREAYVTGVTASADFPTLNPIQPTTGGNDDAFVTKLDAVGAQVYSTYLGGSSDDGAEDIVVNAVGAAYVTGDTFSTDFPTLNASQPTHGGNRDGFVLQIVDAGFLASWGSNAVGQLGNGCDPNATVCPSFSLPSTVPTAPPISDFEAVSSGANHSLALAFGTVLAWGFGSEGQLGDGVCTPFVGAGCPDSGIPSSVSGLTNVVAISGGRGNFSLALRSDGTVWAWGDNDNGQLGFAGPAGTSTPTQVGGLSNVVAIAAGVNYSLALLGDGTVRAWGGNAFGQLGDGVCTPGVDCVDSPLPVQVAGVTNAIAIAAGGLHGMALLQDGTVVSWGRNSNGQLGDNVCTPGVDCNDRSGAQGVFVGPTQLLDNVVALAGGNNFSLALREDGTVWAWGQNNSGQLGDGICTPGVDCVDRSSPAQVAGLGNAVGIVAGGNHSLALGLLGNAVLAWGQNNSGQLGDGSLTATSTVIAAQITDPVAISAGDNHSLGITEAAIPSADLSVQKIDPTDPVTVGNVITYEITVSNAGPDTVNTLTVTDNLPAGLSNVNASGTNWNCTQPVPDSVVECTDPRGNGSSRTFTNHYH